MPTLSSEKSLIPRPKPYSLGYPMLENSPTAATWSVPIDTEPETGQPADLPPELCLSLLTWSLIFFFSHLFGFSHSLQLI